VEHAVDKIDSQAEKHQQALFPKRGWRRAVTPQQPAFSGPKGHQRREQAGADKPCFRKQRQQHVVAHIPAGLFQGQLARAVRGIGQVFALILAIAAAGQRPIEKHAPGHDRQNGPQADRLGGFLGRKGAVALETHDMFPLGACDGQGDHQPAASQGDARASGDPRADHHRQHQRAAEPCGACKRAIDGRQHQYRQHSEHHPAACRGPRPPAERGRQRERKQHAIADRMQQRPATATDEFHLVLNGRGGDVAGKDQRPDLVPLGNRGHRQIGTKDGHHPQQDGQALRPRG